MPHSPALVAEIAHRIAHGCALVSVEAMRQRFQALGYDLDRSLDCRSVARHLESGRTYPACTTGVREIDSGLSAFNVAARRDANFEQLQKLRFEVFAISRGAILEA